MWKYCKIHNLLSFDRKIYKNWAKRKRDLKNYILQITISLTAQDLWQDYYYQISLIILLKEFIKLNVNTATMIKNVTLAELNTKVTDFLNEQTLNIV